MLLRGVVNAQRPIIRGFSSGNLRPNKPVQIVVQTMEERWAEQKSQKIEKLLNEFNNIANRLWDIYYPTFKEAKDTGLEKLEAGSKAFEKSAKPLLKYIDSYMNEDVKFIHNGEVIEEFEVSDIESYQSERALVIYKEKIKEEPETEPHQTPKNTSKKMLNTTSKLLAAYMAALFILAAYKGWEEYEDLKEGEDETVDAVDMYTIANSVKVAIDVVAAIKNVLPEELLQDEALLAVFEEKFSYTSIDFARELAKLPKNKRVEFLKTYAISLHEVLEELRQIEACEGLDYHTLSIRLLNEFIECSNPLKALRDANFSRASYVESFGDLMFVNNAAKLAADKHIRNSFERLSAEEIREIYAVTAISKVVREKKILNYFPSKKLFGEGNMLKLSKKKELRHTFTKQLSHRE